VKVKCASLQRFIHKGMLEWDLSAHQQRSELVSGTRDQVGPVTSGQYLVA